VESEESASILIKAGANIESTDNRGRKVVDVARGAVTKEMLIKMAAERYPFESLNSSTDVPLTGVNQQG
jgi:hypothetical protein